MLLAAISLRKNKSQVFNEIAAKKKKIRRIRINSSQIMLQPDAAKKLRQDDITNSKIVNLVTKLLGDRGVNVAHKKTSEHDHVYIDKLRDELCLQRTTKSSSGKSEHKNKVSGNIDILNKVEEVFGPKNKLQCVQNIAHTYRYCKINGYNAVLPKDPTMRNQTLCFDMEVNQQVMSPSEFEKSKCLIGAVMKKGQLLNVLIKDGGRIKKISDKNFSKKIQHLFTL